MLLSLRWAERSRTAFGTQPGRAIFGIVQGGVTVPLRTASAKALVEMDFHGYALGGLAVGEPQDSMLATIEATLPHLPQTKPRYLMGVGSPDDLIEAARRGIDMFDCVMPTRAGRHGLVYSRFGRINLRNAKHADDPRPIDPLSPCEAARIYSRAYLHHLVKAGRNSRHDAADGDQSRLLSKSDDGYAKRHRSAPVRRFCASDESGLADRRNGRSRIDRRCLARNLRRMSQ